MTVNQKPAAEAADWRLEQLRRAGWPRALAADVAHDLTIDLHRACDLVRRGCPPELAWEILR
jgi:hypothetical protein